MTDRTELERQIAELQAQLAALPEVDPLLVEAREIAARYYDEREFGLARNMRKGLCDDQPSVVSALAALRRGMELASAPAEPVDEAWIEQTARECAAKVSVYSEATVLAGNHDGSGAVLAAKAAIRATLSRVPAAAWPGSGEVSNWAWEIAAKWKAESEAADLTFYNSACLEMARRLKAHMTGGAA
jgi:hypothetical protein